MRPRCMRGSAHSTVRRGVLSGNRWSLRDHCGQHSGRPRCHTSPLLNAMRVHNANPSERLGAPIQSRASVGRAEVVTQSHSKVTMRPRRIRGNRWSLRDHRGEHSGRPRCRASPMRCSVTMRTSPTTSALSSGCSANPIANRAKPIEWLAYNRIHSETHQKKTKSNIWLRG